MFVLRTPPVCVPIQKVLRPNRADPGNWTVVHQAPVRRCILARMQSAPTCRDLSAVNQTDALTCHARVRVGGTLSPRLGRALVL